MVNLMKLIWLNLFFLVHLIRTNCSTYIWVLLKRLCSYFFAIGVFAFFISQFGADVFFCLNNLWFLLSCAKKSWMFLACFLVFNHDFVSILIIELVRFFGTQFLIAFLITSLKIKAFMEAFCLNCAVLAYKYVFCVFFLNSLFSYNFRIHTY